MYCNIENYVLQHLKLCTATFQTVVLQHRKINLKTWNWEHSENICCNNPKISLQYSKIIYCNIKKKLIASLKKPLQHWRKPTKTYKQQKGWVRGADCSSP
jgi:hypothetical protein